MRRLDCDSCEMNVRVHIFSFTFILICAFEIYCRILYTLMAFFRNRK